jgi:hypothetical protein
VDKLFGAASHGTGAAGPPASSLGTQSVTSQVFLRRHPEGKRKRFTVLEQRVDIEASQAAHQPCHRSIPTCPWTGRSTCLFNQLTMIFAMGMLWQWRCGHIWFYGASGMLTQGTRTLSRPVSGLDLLTLRGSPDPAPKIGCTIGCIIGCNSTPGCVDYGSLHILPRGMDIHMRVGLSSMLERDSHLDISPSSWICLCFSFHLGLCFDIQCCALVSGDRLLHQKFHHLPSIPHIHLTSLPSLFSALDFFLHLQFFLLQSSSCFSNDPPNSHGPHRLTGPVPTP